MAASQQLMTMMAALFGNAASKVQLGSEQLECQPRVGPDPAAVLWCLAPLPQTTEPLC